MLQKTCRGLISMVSVQNQVGRLYNSCYAWVNFNFEEIKEPACCKKQAEDGMVTVRLQRCAHDFCTKGAGYTFKRRMAAVYSK